MNPYEVLGVPRGASTDAIKKAYRKQSMKNHPDHNPGDADAAVRYHQVQESFAILSDPERRKRFDETGDTSTPKPRASPDADFLEVVHPALMQVLQTLGRAAPESDLVAKVTGIIRDHRTRGEHRLGELEHARQNLADVADRFETTDPDNLMAQMVRTELHQVEASIDGLKKELDKTTRALDFLKKYKFRRKTFGANTSGLPSWTLSTTTTS